MDINEIQDAKQEHEFHYYKDRIEEAPESIRERIEERLENEKREKCGS